MFLPVNQLARGSHVYCTFTSDQEQYALLARFIEDGLRRNERVLYFTHRHSVRTALAALEINGVGPGLAREGQLHVATAYDSYLRSGRFDIAATKRGWRDAIREAAAAGYAGLRVAGDMSWCLEAIPGAEQIEAYERRLADVFATKFVTGLCQFDGRLFDEAFLARVHDAHLCKVAA